MKLDHLKMMAAAAVVAAISVPWVAAPANALEIKVATFMPPGHHNHKNVTDPFAAAVTEATGGELEVKVFPGGQLGPGPFDQYKRAVEGVAEVTYICQAFTPNLFPKSLLSMQIGTAKTAVEQTERYWDNIDLLRDEYQDVHLLGIWSVAPTVVVTKGHPVRSVEDLAGLKIATGGAAFNPVIEQWGAEPIAMPLGDIQNAVDSGITDGVIISGSILAPPWNLQNVGTDVAVGVPGLMAPCGMIMNKDVWDGLTPEQQAIINEHSGREMSIRAARSFDEENQAALVNARVNPRLTVVDLSDDARQRFIDMATPLARATIKAIEESGGTNVEAAFNAVTQ